MLYLLISSGKEVIFDAELTSLIEENRLDISGLKEIEATTFLPDSDEVLFWGDIPAWKQTKDGLALRITEVTDHFRDITKKIINTDNFGD